MKPQVNGLECGHENDLIAFLYGDLDPAEKSSFDRHMQDCADCQSQFASFADIRESVVAWRNEALSALTASVEPTEAQIGQPGPSALAALREFFNLSPLWMKGTVAFASVLFCLFAVLAAARLLETSPNTFVVSDAGSSRVLPQDFNSEVERRVQEELQRRQASQNEATVAVIASPPVQTSAGRPVNRNHQLAAAPQRKAGRPLSRLERQELAADLRLIADAGDNELVLIGDRINQ